MASLFCHIMTLTLWLHFVVSVADFWVIWTSSQNRSYWHHSDMDMSPFLGHVTKIRTVRVAFRSRFLCIFGTFGYRILFTLQIVFHLFNFRWIPENILFSNSNCPIFFGTLKFQHFIKYEMQISLISNSEKWSQKKYNYIYSIS